jgi:hypothetical protein
MNRQLIRQQLMGNKPLTIRTSDGKEFAVLHPEFMLVGRHNIGTEDPKGLLDVIDLPQVVSIRPGTSRKAHKTASRSEQTSLTCLLDSHEPGSQPRR